MEPDYLKPQANNPMHVDLDKLIDGIEDVTDPSSMAKIMRCVEHIREKDSNFIELLIERVGNAEIYWEVPWYQEQTTLVQQPYRNATDDDSITFRTDTISLQEHNKIEKNWHKFRKKYKLPDQIVSLARWKNKSCRKPDNVNDQARRFAIKYLARGLQRSICQVFHHVKTYYGAYRKGYYSKAEEKIIDICYHHQPKLIAVVLSLVLGREPRGVYKRLHHLTDGKPEQKRLKWTLPLASKLVQRLLKHTKLRLEELKNVQINTEIWRKLEEEMEQDSGYLQHFWYCYLHVQLFVRCDVKLNKLRKRLFKKLQRKVTDSVYKVWSDIRWKDIVSEFPDGFTHRFVYRICSNFVITLKGYVNKPLEDIVEYALQKLKKQKKRKRNKRLRTLRLNEEGQLEVVDYRLYHK